MVRDQPVSRATAGKRDLGAGRPQRPAGNLNRLLGAGKPNQAIAEELVVTAETVKSHVAHILGKLG